MGTAMTIGKLAADACVTAGTIRYYEQLGLLPKPTRTPAGYRHYPASAVHRLTLIRNAQHFGFSLRDIAAFLRVRDRGARPCDSVRQAAQQLLAAVDNQIRELIGRRRQMADTLRRWDRRLIQTAPDRPAHLLEMLAPKSGHRFRRPIASRLART